MKTDFDQLLADLAAASIKIAVNGIKLFLHPEAAVTPDLASRVDLHQAALTEFARLHAPCERCGATARKDISIHGGRSVRRDCQCGATLGFCRWYQPYDEHEASNKLQPYTSSEYGTQWNRATHL